MRTRIYYPFILLIALLTTVSCENELPFSVKDNPPKLVMNALINADSLTNVLYLNFTGRGYATHAEKATVEVRVNGQLSESLRPLPPQAEGDMQCRFNISGKFSPGDVVRIDALTDDGQYHAWAEVTVPLRATQQDDMVGVCLADGGCGSFIQRFQLAVQLFHIAEIGSDRLICQFVAEDNRLVLVIGCNLFPDVAE